MQVHFKIHGQGKKNLNGDGFAIWYTKDRMQPGKHQPCLGKRAGDTWDTWDRAWGPIEHLRQGWGHLGQG